MSAEIHHLLRKPYSKVWHKTYPVDPEQSILDNPTAAALLQNPNVYWVYWAYSNEGLCNLWVAGYELQHLMLLDYYETDESLNSLKKWFEKKNTKAFVFEALPNIDTSMYTD